MRFIGNKESITHEIFTLLSDRELINKKFTLFDAFCGSGSVSDSMKGSFNIIINDILTWCVVYTKGRLCANECNFSKLQINPFEYFNNSAKTKKGFIYKNYSPGGSNRMYFTSENASRIDYFRFQIETWKKSDLLNDKEYAYLLACLIESVSSVSNTAGVYGAFLKKWDPRALKPIYFNKINSLNSSYKIIKDYNNRIEDIITDVECDILYIDPPYTQNQYGTQYHLLETLILNDNPEISKVTGSRPVSPMRSNWSKEYKTNILFDKIIAKTQAKYIVFSYNNDGFMSKEFIESCLKRYGKPNTYICKKILYKKYKNKKTKNDKEHFEYLFFIEKKPVNEIIYECPLNYIGSKAKMISEIRRYIPQETTKIIDVFSGGFNVGINIPSVQSIYNDINHFVTQLIKSFYDYDTYEYLLYIRRITKKFGLQKENAAAYIKARNYFNSLSSEKRDPRFLFTLILYSFQQQIRFNSDYKFNNPIGNRWFNDYVFEKMISYSRRIKECDCTFLSCDFKNLSIRNNKGYFVYLDPPYRLTRGVYNDGRRGFEGWTIQHETALLEFIDDLDKRGIQFMLSYVLENRGNKNEQLNKWINKQKHYSIIKVSNGQGRYSNRKEILIINYEKASLYN